MLSTRTNRHALAALVTTAAVLVPGAAAAADTYEVQPGDTLTSIASRHGVPLDQLIAVNALDSHPHLITPGEVLAIPGAPVPDPSVTPAPAAPTHTVEAGDTLWALARAHGTSVQAIAAANSLADVDFVRIGEVLRIPVGAAAADAATTATAAATAASTVAPGAESAPAESSASDPSTSDVSVYVVQPGDTYWGIAMAHGTTVTALLDANGLSEDAVLREGRRMTLPDAVPSVAPPQGLPGPLLADQSRLALQPAFDRWADANGVPRDLLKALAWYESGWNNTVRSSAGAIGIGQVLPVTAEFVANQLIGVPLDPTVPEDNIRLTARYLRYLIEQTGDERLAVAAYYQGLTAVRVHGVFTSSESYVDGVLSLRPRFS